MAVLLHTLQTRQVSYQALHREGMGPGVCTLSGRLRQEHSRDRVIDLLLMTPQE